MLLVYFLDRSNIMFHTAKGQESAKESIKQVYVSKNILGQCNGRRIVNLELVADIIMSSVKTSWNFVTCVETVFPQKLKQLPSIL